MAWTYDLALYERFAPRMAKLRRGALAYEDLLVPEFRIEEHGDFELFYLPFDAINKGARVVAVGLTPGRSQMRLAYESAVGSLRDGKKPADVLREAMRAATFGGRTRKNLVRMLDAIGVHSALGVESSARLWERQHESLAHMTSAVRYVTVRLKDGRYMDYSGDVLTRHFLRAYVDSTLAPELGSMPDALVIPLGIHSNAAVQHLIREKALDPARCVVGVMHPSPQNEGRFGTHFDPYLRDYQGQARRWMKRH